MFETIFVYGLLTLIMAVCGSVAARREPLYVGKSGLYAENERFLQPEIIIIIASFTFVFGCRYGVGVDYFHYLSIYVNSADERFEILFRGISAVLRKLGFGYPMFFSVWAFLQITFFYYAFRHQRFLFPLLAFFLIIGHGYMSWMNIIRQELASGVFLLSIQYLNERKLWKYLLCVAIACGFHKASIILVVLYPLFLWRKDLFGKISWQLLFYFVALIISIRYSAWFISLLRKPFLFFTDLLGYKNYVFRFLEVETLNSRERFQTNTGYGALIVVFRTLPILLLSRQLKGYYNSSFFNIIYSLWFIRLISNFLVGDSIILNRPFSFFSNFNMIMYAYFTYYCFKSGKSVWRFFGMFYMLLFFVMFIYILSHGDVNTSKFVFFWQ